MTEPTVNDYLAARNQGAATEVNLVSLPKAADHHVPRPCPKLGDEWITYRKVGENYRRFSFKVTTIIEPVGDTGAPIEFDENGRPVGHVEVVYPINDRGQTASFPCQRAGDLIVATMASGVCFPADWVFAPSGSPLHKRGHFHPPDMEWSETELKFVKKAVQAPAPASAKKGG